MNSPFTDSGFASAPTLPFACVPAALRYGHHFHSIRMHSVIHHVTKAPHSRRTGLLPHDAIEFRHFSNAFENSEDLGFKLASQPRSVLVVPPFSLLNVLVSIENKRLYEKSSG